MKGERDFLFVYWSGRKRSRRLLAAFVAALAFHTVAVMWDLPAVARYPHRSWPRPPVPNEGLSVAILQETTGSKLSTVPAREVEGAIEEKETPRDSKAKLPEMFELSQAEEYEPEPFTTPPFNELKTEVPDAQAEVPGETPAAQGGSPLPLVGGNVVSGSPMDGDLSDRKVEPVWLDPSDVKPRYPLGSRLRGEQGTVLIRVRLGGDGFTEEAELVESSGFKALDRAALNAVRKARFRVVGGEMAGHQAVLTIRFRLTD